MNSKVKPILLYSLAAIGVIFIILFVIGLLAPQDGTNINEVIDKWNEIGKVENETGSLFTGFEKTFSAGEPTIDGTDLNSLKTQMNSFINHWSSSVKASKTSFEQANTKLDEESNLITELSNLVIKLNNPDAKQYGENAANYLRERNGKFKICINGLSTVLDSMTIEVDNFGRSYNTKLEIVDLSAKAGTFTNADYINFLNEFTTLENQFNTNVGGIVTKLPPECDEADNYYEKAYDEIKKLEALQ